MPTSEVEIINKLGLHARASSKLTQLASQFQCEVWISRNQKRVNAKSILLETENGPDADQALDAISGLIADKFGEGE